MPTIQGEAQWASVTKPNTKFEPVWTIDVIVDKEQANKLMEQCRSLVETKNDKLPSVKLDEEAGGYRVKIKQRCKSMNGEDMTPPKIIDNDGQPFTGNIGNGSKVKVLFSIARTAYRNQYYISLYLRAVRVVELVPYEADLEEEEFFKTEEAPSKKGNIDDTPFDDDINF